MATTLTVADQIRDMAKRAPQVEALRLRALAQSVEALEAKLDEMRDRAHKAVLAQLNHRCAPKECPNCGERAA